MRDTIEARSDKLEVRMAVAEERLEQLDLEITRARVRLHDLEADRATLRILADQVKDMTNRIDEIARRAAVEALHLAFEARDELGRKRWGLRASWVGLGISSGGFLTAVAFHLLG